MNRLNIIGNLCDEPVRGNVNEHVVANFTVAVNRRQKGKEGAKEADFFRVAAWDQLAENCLKYLSKGKKVAVIGPVEGRQFTKQDGSTGFSLNVRALEVEFLSPAGQQTETPAQEIAQPNLTPVNMDGELPF